MDIIDFFIKESIDRQIVLNEKRNNLNSIIRESIGNCIHRKGNAAVMDSVISESIDRCVRENKINAVITEEIQDARIKGIRNAIVKNAKTVESDTQSMQNDTVKSIVTYAYDIVNALDSDNTGDQDEYDTAMYGPKDKKRRLTTIGANMLHGVLNDLGKAGLNGLTDPAQKFMYDYRNSRDWFERNFGKNGSKAQRKRTQNINGKGSGTNDSVMKLASKKKKYEQEYAKVRSSVPPQTDAAIRNIFSCIDQLVGNIGGASSGNAGAGAGAAGAGANGGNNAGANGGNTTGNTGNGNATGNTGQQPDLSQQLSDFQQQQKDMLTDLMNKQAQYHQQRQNSYNDILKGQKDALDQSKANHDAMMQKQDDMQAKAQANHDAMMQQQKDWQAQQQAMTQQLQDSFTELLDRLEKKKQERSAAATQGAQTRKKRKSEIDKLIELVTQIRDGQVDWKNIDQENFRDTINKLSDIDKKVGNIDKKVTKNGKVVKQRTGPTPTEKKKAAENNRPMQTADGQNVKVRGKK